MTVNHCYYFYMDFQIVGYLGENKFLFSQNILGNLKKKYWNYISAVKIV